jgi:hypothetical protein
LGVLKRRILAPTLTARQSTVFGVPLLKPDSYPPTLRDRLCAAGLSLVVAAMSAFFFIWMVPMVADPSWSSSTRHLKTYIVWSPFWRVIFFGALGTVLGPLSLVVFWKAIRPYTPAQ